MLKCFSVKIQSCLPPVQQNVTCYVSLNQPITPCHTPLNQSSTSSSDRVVQFSCHKDAAGAKWALLVAKLTSNCSKPHWVPSEHGLCLDQTQILRPTVGSFMTRDPVPK